MNTRKIELLILERFVWILATIGYLVFVFLMFRIFIDISTIDFIFRAEAAVGILALAEAICLIAGTIDVSIHTIAGFVGVFILILGQSLLPGTPAELLIIIAPILGLVLGALNGYLVKRIRINSFLITLATGIVFQGIRRLMYEGSIQVENPLLLIPGGGFISKGLSYSLLIIIATTGLLWLILNRTVTGVRIYAIGGGPRASELMGIKVGDVRFLVHMIAGALAGISGLLFIGHNRATTPDMLDLRIFEVFAMAIFGGIALEGGRGRIEDVVAGVFFIGTIYVGMTLMGINVYLRDTVIGGFFLAGILINTLRQRLIDRITIRIE